MNLASQSPGARVNAPSTSSCAFRGRDLAAVAKIPPETFFWNTHTDLEQYGIEPTPIAIAKIAKAWGVPLTAAKGRKLIREMQDDIARDEAEHEKRMQEKEHAQAKLRSEDIAIFTVGINWTQEPASPREQTVREKLLAERLDLAKRINPFSASISLSLLTQDTYGTMPLATDACNARATIEIMCREYREQQRLNEIRRAVTCA